MPTSIYVLHVLCAVVWVGGMTFTLTVLRPVAHATLDGPQRLALMNGVFKRFFFILWHVVPLLLISGWAMLFGWYWGFGASVWHVHLMHMTGLVMAAIFAFIALGPRRRMATALAAGDAAGAAAALDTIRKGVAVNLVLGLVTVAVAAAGRFGG